MQKTILFKKFALIAVILFSSASLFAQTTMPPPKQEKLLNGLKILMWNDKNADKVEVKIRIHDGSAFDPQGKEGVMQLLADNIFPNTASREFFVEDLGGHLEIIANYDYIEVDASSKPEHFLTMLETLAAAVSNPVIDKETTAKIQAELLARLSTAESNTAYVADQAVAQRLFGTFPYGRPQLGTSETVKKFVFADLVDAKERFLTSDNATITLTGNFDRDLGYKAIRRYFGGWLKADKVVPSTFRQPDPPKTAVLSVPSPNASESAIRFAARGVARNDKDFAASLVFTTILENRLKARVPTAHSGEVFVRDEAHTLPGSIVIGLSINKTALDEKDSKIEANDLIPKAMSDPITDGEFQTAKKAVQDEWSKRDAATMWLDADTFNLASAGADNKAIKAVTLADVRSFSDKFRKLPMASVLVNTPEKAN